jgi:hypothetical protein
MRARMKPGHSPIVLGGCTVVPGYPEYWDVPEVYSDAILNLVEAGVCEYEPPPREDAPTVVVVADRAGFPARRRARS